MTFYNLIKLAEEQKQERDPNALKKGIAGIGAGLGAIGAGAILPETLARGHLHKLNMDAASSLSDARVDLNVAEGKRSLLAGKRNWGSGINSAIHKFGFSKDESTRKGWEAGAKAFENWGPGRHSNPPPLTARQEELIDKFMKEYPGQSRKDLIDDITRMHMYDHRALDPHRYGEAGMTAEKAKASHEKWVAKQNEIAKDLSELENSAASHLEDYNKKRKRLERAKMLISRVPIAIGAGLAGYGGYKLYRHFKDKNKNN